MTTTVNDVEHIESQSYYGIGVVKIFFQQNADINGAVAQVTAIAQANLRSMPPGTTPPLVIAYTGSSVPILQLAPHDKRNAIHSDYLAIGLTQLRDRQNFRH